MLYRTPRVVSLELIMFIHPLVRRLLSCADSLLCCLTTVPINTTTAAQHTTVSMDNQNHVITLYQKNWKCIFIMQSGESNQPSIVK
jgi:hypothetical protein